MANLAGRIVYRHACDCKWANAPLDDGEDAEHRFDVDGQPFPWHISEDGARFTRLLDDFYRVDVDILPILRAKPDNKLPTGGRLYRDARTKEEARSEEVRDSRDGGLFIAGVEFPWVIAEDGIAYTRSRTTVATITLSFFAESVDTDGEVTDERELDDADICSDTGNVYFHGTQVQL